VFNDARILSRPLEIHWAGWETTTYRLQQAGWQLSADQDVYNDRLRLAMKHEGMALYGMSGWSRFEYEARIRDPREFPVIVMQAMGREVWVQEHGRVELNFQAIDAKPCFTERKITKLEDLAHFAAPLVRSREIIIPEENVDELLEKILKLQQPARTDRIREEMRRGPEGRMVTDEPQQKFQAQIISLAA
jgi:hypothetical protein